jgi:hypothetical protein
LLQLSKDCRILFIFYVSAYLLIFHLWSVIGRLTAIPSLETLEGPGPCSVSNKVTVILVQSLVDKSRITITWLDSVETDLSVIRQQQQKEHLSFPYLLSFYRICSVNRLHSRRLVFLLYAPSESAPLFTNGNFFATLLINSELNIPVICCLPVTQLNSIKREQASECVFTFKTQRFSKNFSVVYR